VRVTDDPTEDLCHIKAFISARHGAASEGVIDRIRQTLVILRVYHAAQDRSDAL
jgi:hypothetical protein